MPTSSTSAQNSSGFTLWLLGPTSSGKTTIAELLAERLRGSNTAVLHYDGDEVRDFFGENHGFEPSDRARVVGTLIHLTNKATAAGINVIVSALTANEDARILVREKIPDVITGYIECSIEACAKRDPKGLYAKAERGEITTLIGVNTAYLPPENPDIVINTEKLTPTEATDTLVQFLREKNLIQI